MGKLYSFIPSSCFKQYFLFPILSLYGLVDKKMSQNLTTHQVMHVYTRNVYILFYGYMDFR